MSRVVKIYVLSRWVERLPFAAFTVKHELHAFAKREGLYDRNIRVTILTDGRGGSRDVQLSEDTP